MGTDTDNWMWGLRERNKDDFKGFDVSHWRELSLVRWRRLWVKQV